MEIDMKALKERFEREIQGVSKDRIDLVKRSLKAYLGSEYDDEINRTIPTEMTIESRVKRRKLFTGRSAQDFRSQICPIIMKRHKTSYYDDPRDKIQSDLSPDGECAAMLECCDRCQLMTGTIEGLRALVSNDGYEHYTCDGVKRQSEISGCAFCDLITKTMARCQNCNGDNFMGIAPGILGDGTIRVHAITKGSIAPDQSPFQSGAQLKALRLLIPMDPMVCPDQDPHHHDLPLVAFQESPASKVVEGRRPDKKLTPDLAKRLHRWLNDCQDKHKSCPRRCFPNLPTRLVDIGNRKDSPIRLHIPDKDVRCQYVALSYCWGGDQPYKTTVSNLARYTKELPVDDFPKTITDALEVCREIGMRYIWIDALCIIQDDPKDKIHEIAQMGNIYKDATITVMAASASSVYEGFLGNSKIDAPAAKLPLHLDENSFGAVFVRGPDNLPFLDDEPAFNRAWTMQEMLLSQRIIIFDSYQVVLKCAQDNIQPAANTHLHSNMRIGAATGPKYRIMQGFNLAALESEQQKEQDLRHLDTGEFLNTQALTWAGCMAEYSRRDITVVDDRYPALAGITENLQKIWSDEYVAGFWKNSLIEHLGWSGGVNGTFGGRAWTERLEGPSWSWLSHPAPVSVNPISITDVDVLGCEIELEFPDQPFGKVKRGVLCLEGRTLPLSELHIRQRPNVSPWWKRAMAMMPEIFDGISYDFPDRGLATGELKALLLGLTSDRKTEDHSLSLLVIRQREGGTYERVGNAVFNDTVVEGQMKYITSKATREVIILE